MKKPNEGQTEVIRFDEFIDIIIDNRGEEIKKQIKLIEKTIKKDK
jgi:hypothetical protein